MCLAVGKLTEDEDVVITGSKDHYIKVRFLARHVQYARYDVCSALHFIVWNASKWYMTTCKVSTEVMLLIFIHRNL